MSENHVALMVAVLSMLGTVVNMWLKLSLRLEVLQMRKAIMDEIDLKYARAEDTKRRLDQIENRCLGRQ